MKDLLVKAGKDKQIILLHGEEDYLIDENLEGLKKTLDDNFFDFNFETIDAGEATFEGIHKRLETLPVFSNQRFLLINDVDLSRTNVKKLDYILEPLVEYFMDFPQHGCLIIRAKGRAFKGKFYKSVEKYGGVVEFKKLNQGQVRTFISNYLAKEGLELTKNELDLIIDLSHYLDSNLNKTLYDLKNELDKLLERSKSQSLTHTVIKETMVTSFETNIFKIMDAILGKNKKELLLVYQSFIDGKGDRFQIFYMIIRQLRLLLYVKEYRRRKVNGQKSLSLSSFEYHKILDHIHNWTYKELYQALHLSYFTEKMIKSSGLSEEVLIDSYLARIF